MEKGRRELREFFRVEADIPMFVRRLAGKDASNYECNLSGQGFDEGLKHKLMRRINISGAGICFESDESYSLGDILEMRFMLEDVYSGLLAVSAAVLRSERRPKGYCIAVKYASIDEQIIDMIVKFVFQRERILIQERRVGWI